jgi:hypothetical protein
MSTISCRRVLVITLVGVSFAAVLAGCRSCRTTKKTRPVSLLDAGVWATAPSARSRRVPTLDSPAPAGPRIDDPAADDRSPSGAAPADSPASGVQRVPDSPEANERRARFFEKYDQDGDGAISEHERAAMRRGRVAATFAAIDSDGDGALDPDEVAQAPGRARRILSDFAAADADGNGRISEAELEAVMTDRRRGRLHRDR